MNPWSTFYEWNGSWSDEYVISNHLYSFHLYHHPFPMISSPLWDSITEQEKRKLRFRRADDGEFWMDLKELMIIFEQLHIFHYRIESIGDWDACSSPTLSSVSDKEHSAWHELNFHGQWKMDESAGGRGTKDQPAGERSFENVKNSFSENDFVIL